MSEENNLGVTSKAVVVLACEISMNELNLVLGFSVRDMGLGVERMVLSSEESNDEFVAAVSDLVLEGIACD